MQASGAGSKSPYVQWYAQHKTLVWGAAAAAVTVYATYKVTSTGTTKSAGDGNAQGPQERRQQNHFQRLFGMVKNYSEAASTLAETAALVSGDLRSFLTSDASDLPQSLKQLNKLLQAPEFQATVSTVTASVVRGATSAIQGQRDGPPLVDTIIEAILSERGRGLVGMAVGVAMRNSTAAICEFVERRLDAPSGAGSRSGNTVVKDLLDLLASDQGEKVLTLLLTQSIRTAVISYVDSTAGYNLCDDMLASIVKQEHRDALTDLLSRITASFCKEAVLSYRRATASGSVSANAVNHLTIKNAASAAGLVSCSSVPAATSREGFTTVAGVSVCTSGAAAGGETSLTASLPIVKSYGHLTGGQNARPSQASQLHKQGNNTAALMSSSNAATGSANRALSAQGSPLWLRKLVDLARERDVRSLAVDVVKSASREATRGAVEGFMQSTRASPGGESQGGLLVLPPNISGAKLYMLATLAVSLCTYALSPRVLML